MLNNMFENPLSEKLASDRARLHRRGAVIVLVAMLLPVLLVILGFSVDLAMMQLSRTELQVVSDLSAKAGAQELLRTQDDSIARQVAKKCCP